MTETSQSRRHLVPGRSLSSSSASEHHLRSPFVTRPTLRYFSSASFAHFYNSTNSAPTLTCDNGFADTGGPGFPPLAHRPQPPCSSPSRILPTALDHQTFANCLPSQTASAYSLPTVRQRWTPRGPAKKRWARRSQPSLLRAHGRLPMIHVRLPRSNACTPRSHNGLPRSGRLSASTTLPLHQPQRRRPHQGPSATSPPSFFA